MRRFSPFRKDKGVENTDKGLDEEKANMGLSHSLDINVSTIKEIFSSNINTDFRTRGVYIKALKADGVLMYLNGMVNENTIHLNIIEPLINNDIEGVGEKNIDFLMKGVLTVKDLMAVGSIKEVVHSIRNGSTVLLIEGYSEAIRHDTTQYAHRAIEKPTVEGVIRGPKEAFSEAENVNISLIRKAIRSENLITEIMSLGKEAVLTARIMYMKDIADPKLVEKVKYRMGQIDADIIQVNAILEQHLEDRTYSIIPTVLLTERPDRTVSFLMEGHVAILLDGSPYAAVVPTTFWALFHTSEDHFQRWPVANFMRMIRLFSLFITLLSPGAYIAVTTFHAEMVPTDLLLSIAAARERVPFPVVVEILLMELSFELIREAGIRIPAAIGPTIGIVGALILGQAAVQANIVSPILVIIVSITGLASYAIPEQSLGFIVRVMRFVFIILAAMMGFYAMGVFLTVCVAYISSVKSFDVPFMSPKAPNYPSSGDLLYRPAAWSEWLRPFHVNPQHEVRQKKPRKGGKLGD